MGKGNSLKNSDPGVRIEKKAKGYCGLVNYPDDFVACFQYKEEAMAFYESLKARMGYFGLELEGNKTRLIEFGRYAEQNRRKRGEGKPARRS